MEFDLLVRKYLRGTLSPDELERLRDLLERVPEYRNELRQILELRSIIHDDALRLVPPRDLSDRTRERVAAQFAGIESLLRDDASRLATPGELADATRVAVGQLFAANAAELSRGNASAAPSVAPSDAPPRDDESERRRAIILPYRVVGRVLLAASIAITVALSPTLLGPSGDGSDQLASRRTNETSAPADATAGSSSRGAARASDETGTGVDEITPLVAASVSSMRSERRDDLRLAAVAATPADASVSSGTVASGIVASGSVEAGAVTPSVVVLDTARAVEDRAAALAAIDPDNPISRVLRSQISLDGRTYNPAIDSSLVRRDEPLAALALSTFAVPGVGADARRLSVGVTLGSGNVMDADAPAALMQNSYYFSFSVSGTDRIGIEMGGSTFLQEKHVPGKRPAGDIFAKGDAGDSTGNATTLQPGALAPPMVAQRVKEDITYGGVFYDRRLTIERQWDVCGRVTFGAADGALVAGIRAYTAYSPTKNVTLTLGIGGSTLFDLKRSNDDGSTNYGLYYGIETGF